MTKTPESKAMKLFALISKACHAFENIAGSARGHIRFSYKGKNNQIVLVCDKGRIMQIIAIDKIRKKVVSIPWDCCEFSKYTPEEAFSKFFNKIKKIEVSHPRVNKAWSSLTGFEAWLKDIVNGTGK